MFYVNAELVKKKKEKKKKKKRPSVDSNWGPSVWQATSGPARLPRRRQRCSQNNVSSEKKSSRVVMFPGVVTVSAATRRLQRYIT